MGTSLGGLLSSCPIPAISILILLGPSLSHFILCYSGYHSPCNLSTSQNFRKNFQTEYAPKTFSILRV